MLAPDSLWATLVPTLAAAYRPRRPTETVLYALVREHLETFLAHAQETYAAPLPRYVEDELRGYLRCGVFAHGFIRARCTSCEHELLVAFSCKHRGVCPSCAGRRMANVAAALVDRVLPAVPVRQWVLSLPFELRILAAFDAKVLTALSRIFADVVGRWYCRWAERAGVGRGDGVRPGAVTFVQRFGSSLNLNVHFHTCFLDGVYVRESSGRPGFHVAPSPTLADLAGVVAAVHRRALGWLARHGHRERSPPEELSNEAALPSPIEACAAIATQRGTMRSLQEEEATSLDLTDLTKCPDGLDSKRPRREGGASEHGGFNLHASVRIAADDDLGRERLCRYGVRPAFSLERLRVLAGGRIAYRTKRLGGRRAKHRVMTPLELMARLAALVPPPRYPLVRYHGVLAPHAAWRREVVPRPPVEAIHHHRTTAHAGSARSRAPSAGYDGSPHGGPSRPSRGRGSRASETGRPHAGSTRTGTGMGVEAARRLSLGAATAGERDTSSAVTRVTPNILSVRHWSRLLGGLLYAASPRLRWAELLRRTFDVDVLACPRCHGRIHIVEAIADKDAARQILERLGIAPDVLRPVRARDPTSLDGTEPDAA